MILIFLHLDIYRNNTSRTQYYNAKTAELNTLIVTVNIKILHIHRHMLSC